MKEEEKEKLLKRNQEIIKIILEEINKKCPNTIDLIGIAGSFCNNTYYEKSDLDLFIISNNYEVSNVISKCFILNDIGFDIYISTWDTLSRMSQYNNQYVTKLKQLDIVYTRDNKVLEKYKYYQEELNKNMLDTKTIKNKVNKYYSLIIAYYNKLRHIEDKNEYYSILGQILSYIETIIYMMNKEYVRGGTKTILKEILYMKKTPSNFLANYLDLLTITNTKFITTKLKEIIDSLKECYNLEDLHIKIPSKEYNIKTALTPQAIKGTYEELYSNYYNKMLLAVKTNNRYISFRTMLDAQSFFDEIYEIYDIPKIRLIDKYNPYDLKSNADSFIAALKEWKKLYDSMSIKINNYTEVSQIYKK